MPQSLPAPVSAVYGPHTSPVLPKKPPKRHVTPSGDAPGGGMALAPFLDMIKHPPVQEMTLWHVLRRHLYFLAVALAGCLGTADSSSDGAPASVCGNGIVDVGEACDDGYTSDCGACNATCSGAGFGIGVCGDGEFCPEAGEACDDGHTTDCGDCNADCSAAGTGSTCGDGVVCEDTEVCDDNFRTACGSCNATCSGAGSGASTCGDGVWRPDVGEVCDDGHTTECGACNADCSAAGTGSVCGDGVICPDTEECENPTPAALADACDGCLADCTAVASYYCGDGYVCGDEACDDGHTTQCGSCDATCEGPGTGSTCGDGVVCEDTEACDDGHTTACGDCNADCSGGGSGMGMCGDGVWCPDAGEACDDGFTSACGTCDATCSGPGSSVAMAVCGDGDHCPEANEFCDDGFETECGLCNADCTANGTGSTCGDGFVCDDTEACDDGNTLACGACDATCGGPGSGSCLEERIVVSAATTAGGAYDIIVMDSTGAQHINLTASLTGDALGPRISPTGQAIAFTRQPSVGDNELWVASAGGMERILTREGIWMMDWLDDDTILYRHDLTPTRTNIGAIKMDGQDDRILIDEPFLNLHRQAGNVAVAPNGQTIASTWQQGGYPASQDVFLTNRDGGSGRVFYGDIGDFMEDADVVWSADSQRVFWVQSQTSGGVHTVLGKDLSTSNNTTTSDVVWSDARPLRLCATSPDGEFLLLSQQDGSSGILFTVRVDNGRVKTILSGSSVELGDWAPLDLEWLSGL